MKRQLYKDLLKWKNNKSRKPLLLQGARQVGKTYLVNMFAEAEYRNYVYLNFEEDEALKTLFEGSLSPDRLIESIGFYLGKKITSKDTLLFLDEIQICPKAITSLKYFYEKAPEFHIVAAGSLLGVSVGKESSFPVGKVHFMTLYPMNFIEYLNAIGETLLADKLQQINKIIPLDQLIHDKLMKLLKTYLFTGGMPEVLLSYINNKDVSEVRVIQKDILKSYQRDFSKYSDSKQAIKTSDLWNSIPFQLAKENKKFKYSDVKKGSRASFYEETVEWLRKAGLINIAYNISTPKLPLSGYSDKQKFKIFLLDSGLLGAMLKIPSKLITTPTDIFSEYNGAFIDNFVASELVSTNDNDLYFWTSQSAAEVDFILQKEDKIIPFEVKSGLNRNKKSLQSYNEKYKPAYLMRTSPRNFTKDSNFINLPLYASFLAYNNFL